MMMRRLALLCGGLVLGATLCQARQSGGGVPDLNVKQSCREAQAVSADGDSRNSGDDQVNTYKACMQDEMQAHDQLAKSWSKFKPVSRQTCVAQANPSPSYVEILTCLEMNDESGIPFRTDNSGVAPASTNGASGSPSATPGSAAPSSAAGGSR